MNKSNQRIDLTPIYDPRGTGRIFRYPLYVKDIPFYNSMYQLLQKTQQLVVLDNPAQDSGYVKLATHSPMSGYQGFSNTHILYAEMATAASIYVRQFGVQLCEGDVTRHRFAFAALYLLMTGAVVYSYPGKAGAKTVIASKCGDLIRSEIPLSNSRYSELYGHCSETEAQITSGKLKVVTMELGSGGGLSKPRCGEINVNRKGALILPLMSLLQYSFALCNGLAAQNPVRLVYIGDDNRRAEILTSLNPQIMRAYSIGGDLVGHLKPETPTVLTLPDLENRCLAEVPLTGIMSINYEVQCNSVRKCPKRPTTAR
jgi:hypothetical protein